MCKHQYPHQPVTMRDDEEQTVLGAWRRYVVDTTVGGVRRAARPGVVGKVLWAVAIVTATAMLVFSIQALVTRGPRQLGSATRVDDTRAQPFPAVTVCHVRRHLTPIMPTTTTTTTTITTASTTASMPPTTGSWAPTTTAAKNTTRTTATTRPLTTTNGTSPLSSTAAIASTDSSNNNGFRRRKKRLAVHVSTADRLAYQTIVDTASEDELVNSGYSLENILLGCRLGDYYCDAGNFTHYYDHSLGNCYTFTTNPADLHTYRAGPHNGLTLELGSGGSRLRGWYGEGINKRAATPAFPVTQNETDETGFVIMVHTPGDTVFASDEGVHVPPGRASYLAVTKSVTTKPSSGECVDREQTDTDLEARDIFTLNTGWRYSQRGCQRTCLQRSLVMQCGCCDVSMPCPALLLDVTSFSRVAAPRCNLNNTSQASCLADTVKRYADGTLSCLAACKPRCRTTRYPTRLSLTTWEARTPYLVTPSAQGGTGKSAPQTNTAQKANPTEAPAYSTMMATATEFVPAEGSGQGAMETATDDFSATTAGLTRTTQPLPVVESQRKKRQLGDYEIPTYVTADVRVHVYFEDLRTRITEPVTSDEWVELMADIGGVASLWLGLSVLGMLELVHMFVEWCLLAFNKCCSKGGHSVVSVIPLGSAQ